MSGTETICRMNRAMVAHFREYTQLHVTSFLPL